MPASRPTATVVATLLAAALALTAGLAVPTAYAVPPGWSTPEPLPDTAGAVNQVSDTAPNGADAAVWVAGAGDGVELQARVRGPGESAWRAVTPIATSQANQLDIASDRHGNFWVTWVLYDPATSISQVRAAMLRTASADFSEPRRVFSFDGYGSLAPRIAVADDDTVFVAAAAKTVPSVDPTRYRVALATKRPGKPWQDRFLSPRDQNGYVQSLAVSPNGHAVVAFLQGDSSTDYRVRAATRPAGRQTDWTVSTLAPPGDGQTGLAAIGTDGTVAVVWNASGTTILRLAHRDLTGGGDWVVTDVEVGPGNHPAEQPSVAPDGGITVLWTKGRVYARQVEDGVVAPAVPVTPDGVTSGFRDSELTTDGRVALLYQSYDGSNVSQGLSLVLVGNGEPGSPLEITTAADGSANGAGLGLDAADGADVLWTAGDYPATELVSTGNPPLAPAVLTRPHFGTPVSTASVQGRPRVGRTVTCKTGYVVEARQVRWHWYREGSAIRGAREPRYQLRAADRGSRVQCSMSALGLAASTDLVSPGRLVR